MSSQPLEEQNNRKRPAASKRRKGRMLMILGPVAVIAASLYVYFTGGRFIETDNAYVQADKVTIGAEVSGPVVAVSVSENEAVSKGRELFQLDDRDFVIAVEKARAGLSDVLAEITTLKAKYLQKTEELKLAQTDLDFATKEYQRQQTLQEKKVGTVAQLDEVRHTYDAKQQQIKIIGSEIDQILSSLGGNPQSAPEELPAYKLAKAELDDALLRLERTVVKAPFAGRVSKLPKPGRHVSSGSGIMTLVADHDFWIEANLKETELTHIQPQQPVEIQIDAYPGKTWSGTVESISPASGAEYSIIPAQNATGNWVKVVQRIPVRIIFDTTDEKFELRSGMSTTVRIDTNFHRPLPALVSTCFSLFDLSEDAHAAIEKQ